eukprot:CAMPEP_0177637588 /NCGR_PEP_ID=MMETSP0447-20121125/5048_1 /TAXON_ID=0 /ORGANISM="Stygamoeba regulata, Strain BSH-02190019" /LENGTH=478 /DNA_ID=CAMNT_0019139519 /DNA_START=84 /DNA_END=1517 /DNA_ORIENTATION=-
MTRFRSLVVTLLTFIAHPAVLWVLFFLMGTSSWLIVNGLFVEIPLFMTDLPERTAVSSYIAVIIQLANLAPLLFVFLRSHQFLRTDTWTIGFNHVLGVVVCLLLGLFWRAQLDGHSVGLFILTFFGGVTGALSVVVYYPFATRFGITRTSAVSTGMGATAIIASVLGIIQSPGAQNRFAAWTYFLLLGIVTLVALGALLLILLYGQRNGYLEEFYWHTTEGTTPSSREVDESVDESSSLLHTTSNLSDTDDTAAMVPTNLSLISEGDEMGEMRTLGSVLLHENLRSGHLVEPQETSEASSDDASSLLFEGNAEHSPEETDSLTRHLREHALTFANQFWINFANYFIKTMFVFSVANYANAATLTLWLNVVAMLTDPFGRMLTSLFRFTYVSLLIFFDTILFAFLLWVSIQGQDPPLPSPWGGWFIVAINGVFALVFGYVETVIYQLVAVQNPPPLVQSVSRYVALTNQAGAFCGSMIS